MNALAGGTNKDSWIQSGLINEFVYSFRIMFFKLMKENEGKSICLKDDCRDTKLLEKISTNSEFTDACLFNSSGIVKTNGKRDFKSKIYGSYIDFRHTPSPKMVHSVCTIFGCIGLGNVNGLKLIDNVSKLQGQRTSAVVLKEGFTFFQPEEDYVAKVRL
jgi:hypothetical protein